MRSILEQAVIHHLNGDSDKAAELFHQFIVARARQIHESMRNGEEVEECDDEAVSETYFGEEDLAELEDNGGEDIDDGGDEFAAADDVSTFGDEEEGDDLGDFGDDDLGDDLGADDLGAEGGDFEDKLEELQAELERLTAEFEELKGEEGEEGEDTDLAGELDDDMGDDAGVAPPAFGGGEEDDQEFDAFAESFTSELEKVSVSLKTDGAGVGTGSNSNITHNGKSPGLQKGIQARQGGSPNMSKQSEHKGFARETPPSTGDLAAGMTKKPRNAHPKASLSPVAHPKPTEGKEVGNGGSVKTNTKSPTSGVGRKGR